MPPLSVDRLPTIGMRILSSSHTCILLVDISQQVATSFIRKPHHVQDIRILGNRCLKPMAVGSPFYISGGSSSWTIVAQYKWITDMINRTCQSPMTADTHPASCYWLLVTAGQPPLCYLQGSFNFQCSDHLLDNALWWCCNMEVVSESCIIVFEHSHNPVEAVEKNTLLSHTHYFTT